MISLEKIKHLKNSKLYESFTTSGLTFIFRILGMGLSFLIIRVIAKNFGIETFGSFSIIQTIVNVLLIIFTLGIQNTLLIEFNRQELDQNSLFSFVNHTFKLVFFFMLIPSILLIFYANFLAKSFNDTSLANSFRLLGFFLFPILAHDIIVYYFIATKNYFKFGFFMFFLPNFLFIISLFFLNNEDKNITKISLIYFISYLVTFFIEYSSIYVKNKKNRSYIPPYKSILKRSIPMMISWLMLYLLSWTDVILLGIMSEPKEVGEYNLAYKIGSLLLIFLSTYTAVALPKMSEYFERKEIHLLKKYLKKSSLNLTLVCLPFFLILLFFGNFVISFFGETSSNTVQILVIISISSMLSVFFGCVDQILNISNNQNTLLKINLFYFVANIILNIILITYFGALGSAIATLVITILMKLTCIFFINKKLGFLPIGI
ncbi:oligosaccharide flippase family protein [Empedobacter falsenii]|uniref:oligosaccharide flippase family protein n=1 Tax=Empedobacter falsenii TaxID=343874 RepID=UPI003A8022D0